MTIRTIGELAANVWSPMTSINNIKPNDPITGTIYHDPGTNKTYVFNGHPEKHSWVELKMHSEDAEINKKRIRKIEKLFKI